MAHLVLDEPEKTLAGQQRPRLVPDEISYEEPEILKKAKGIFEPIIPEMRTARSFVEATKIPALLGFEKQMYQIPFLPSRQELSKMSWYKKWPEAVGYVGENLAELYLTAGALKAAGALPVGYNWLQKAGATAVLFGTQQATKELRKGVAESIHDEDYGYEGAPAVLESMAIGAIFSIAHSGIKGTWNALKPTEQKAALKILGLKKDATPEEITRAARGLALQFHPDKMTARGIPPELEPQMRGRFDKIIKARNYLLKPSARDIVYRAGKKPPVKPVKAPSVAQEAITPAEPTKTVPEISIKRQSSINLLERYNQLSDQISAMVQKGDWEGLETWGEKYNVEHLNIYRELQKREVLPETPKIVLEDWERAKIKYDNIERRKAELAKQIPAEPTATAPEVTPEMKAAMPATNIQKGRWHKLSRGMTEDQRRDLLEKFIGKRSTTGATVAEMDNAIEQMTSPPSNFTPKEQKVIDKVAKYKSVPLDNYLSERSRLSGMPAMPSDPEIRTDRLRTLKSIARQQEKFIRKKRLELAKRKKEKNILNPWTSARHTFMTVEEQTGTPLTQSYENIIEKAARTDLEAEKFVKDRLSEVASAKDLLVLSAEENEQIGKWIFSPETRVGVEGKLSPKAQAIAGALEDIFQNISANEVREIVFRRWAATGQPPPDVGTYGDPKSILAEGKAAKLEGNLKSWIASQQWGTRRFYYLSDPTRDDLVDEFIKSLQVPSMAEVTAPLGQPSSIISEAYPREGMPEIRTGSVITNTINHLRRAMTTNAIADDLEAFYEQFRKLNPTSGDKQMVKDMFNNILHKGRDIRAPYKQLAEARKMFWRNRLSLIGQPNNALWSSFRNSLENIAHGGAAFNVPEATKSVKIIMKGLGEGKTLREINPRLWQAYLDDFPTIISQRLKYYKEFLMMDVGNISKDYSDIRLLRQAAVMLEKTGQLYGQVDSNSRAMIWIAQYEVVERNAQKYLDGKISLRQFYNRTDLDTVRDTEKLMVQDLLSQARTDPSAIDKLARKSAKIAAFDTNFGYSTPTRALVEQTPEQRTIMGIYTFARGVFELQYYRGIKPMLDGFREMKDVGLKEAIKSGAFGQAKRGMKNFLKVLVGSSLAGTMLSAIVGRKAYNLYQTLAYSGLDPGTGQILNMLDHISLNVWQWQQGKQTLPETVDRIAEGFGQLVDIFFPLIDQFLDLAESVSDTRSLSSYKVIREGVKKYILGKEPKFQEQERTGYQKLMHILMGTYEYVPEEEKKFMGM